MPNDTPDVMTLHALYMLTSFQHEASEPDARELPVFVVDYLGNPHAINAEMRFNPGEDDTPPYWELVLRPKIITS